MKKVFVSIVIIFTGFCCHAQRLVDKEFIFSAGLDVGYNLASFEPVNNLGFAISAEADYIFSEAASLSLNVQYVNFSTKSYTDSSNGQLVKKNRPAFTAFPVLIGIKCSFAEDKYYFHPQVGVAFGTRYPVTAAYRFSVGTTPSKHTDFSIGYEGLQKKRESLLSVITVRAAYVF